MSLVKIKENRFPLVFDDLFKTDWLGGTSAVNNTGFNSPAVNIKDNEEEFVLEVAAPGRTRDSFNIELNNDRLTVSSIEKKENEENNKFTRKEFDYSTFKRIFRLPETIDNSKINASYKDGVLLITLPKKEEAKIQPKRFIEIS